MESDYRIDFHCGICNDCVSCSIYRSSGSGKPVRAIAGAPARLDVMRLNIFRLFSAY